MDDYFFGLSTSGHDPAFAVVNQNCELLFAESTERFVQQKRAWGIDSDHPEHIRSVLPHILTNKLANFTFARTWARSKSNLYLDVASGSFTYNAYVKWLLNLQDKDFTKAAINLQHYLKQPLVEPKNFDHHLCHAVNACTSFKGNNALCLVIDGEGEVGSLSIYRLANRELKRLTRSWGPGSLGNFYGLLTQLCGFDWRKGEEWKVMGLAAFGNTQPELIENFKSQLTIKNGKIYFPNLAVFESFTDLLNVAPNPQNYMSMADVAASGQEAYTYFVNEILKHCEQYEEDNLIISGGCALNSSFNGSIVGNSSFKKIHVPSAPADDGNAIGAAILAWMEQHNIQKIPYTGLFAYLGTDIKWDNKAANTIKKLGFSKITDLGDQAAKVMALKLFEGKIIGVMRGKAEFGPRALGNRSILASPLDPNMKDRINNLVKEREPFRPFAPVVEEKQVSNYFQKNHASPYMSFTLPWKPEMLALVPAVVHQDGTGRLQTVDEANNPWFSSLLSEFDKLSGIPILLNTSFNIMGKPIVHSLDDALVVLVTTGLDAVLFGNILIEKY